MVYKAERTKKSLFLKVGRHVLSATRDLQNVAPAFSPSLPMSNLNLGSSQSLTDMSKDRRATRPKGLQAGGSGA